LVSQNLSVTYLSIRSLQDNTRYYLFIFETKIFKKKKKKKKRKKKKKKKKKEKKKKKTCFISSAEIEYLVKKLSVSTKNSSINVKPWIC